MYRKIEYRRVCVCVYPRRLSRQKRLEDVARRRKQSVRDPKSVLARLVFEAPSRFRLPRDKRPAGIYYRSNRRRVVTNPVGRYSFRPIPGFVRRPPICRGIERRSFSGGRP